MIRFVPAMAAITFVVVTFDIAAWVASSRNPTESTLSLVPARSSADNLIGGLPSVEAKPGSSLRSGQDGVVSTAQSAVRLIDLETALDETKRTATARIRALETQLASEQTKTTSLDGDLAHAREQLAQAERDMAAQTVANKGTDPQDRQQAVAAALDEAKRSATAQVEALKTQLANEQARTTSLDGDLGHAREQLAQAEQEKAAQAIANKEIDLQSRQQAIAAALDEAKRNAAAQVEALRAQLASEQAKTTSLDGDLAQAREQLVRAERDKAAQVVVKDKEAEPQDRQQAVAAALDEAKRNAAAQVETLQAQLANERSKTIGLDGDLAQAREQLAQAERDKAAQAAAAQNKVTELQGRQQAIAAALDEAKRDAKAQVEALQSELATAQAKTASLDGDLGHAREQMAQAERDRGPQAAAAKDKVAELQDRQQQAATAALDAAKRNAQAQVEALQTQLADGQARIRELDGSLARTREQLAQADRDRAAQVAAAMDKMTTLQARQQPLAEALEQTKRRSTTKIHALETQLADEQAKTSSLDGDLAHARDQLAQAERDRAAQATLAKAKEAELEAKQRPLAEALDQTKRSATAQVQALQSRLASEQAKTSSLDGDLAQAREQLAQAERDAAAPTAAAPAAAAASATAAEDKVELQAEQQRLAEALKQMKRNATAEIKALQSQLADEQAKTASLDADLAHAREQLGRADQDKAAAAAKAKEVELQAKQRPLAEALDETKRTATAQIEDPQNQVTSEQVRATSLDIYLRDQAAQAAAASTKEAELQARQDQAVAAALDETRRNTTAQMQALQTREQARMTGYLADARDAQSDEGKAAPRVKDKPAKPPAKQQAGAASPDAAKSYGAAKRRQPYPNPRTRNDNVSRFLSETSQARAIIGKLLQRTWESQ